MEKEQVSAILKEKEAAEKWRQKWRRRIFWFIFIALILVMASLASILP